MFDKKNSRKSPRFGIILSIAFLALNVFGQPPNTVQRLSLNQPIERQIKGGETHSFEFHVKAGHYARAEVEQKNIDVVVSLFAPNGKLVVEMDGKDGRLWREAVSCIAEEDGTYRIAIEAYGGVEQSGKYTIRLAETRLSSPNDQKRLEAEAHLNAGRKLYLQGGASRLEAVKEYEVAAYLWRELFDEQWEAITQTILGRVYFNLYKTKESIAANTLARKLFQKTKDLIGESKAVKWLGVTYYNRTYQHDKALEYFKQTLILQKEINAPQKEVGQTLEDLGLVSIGLQQREEARNYLEQALLIWQEIKNKNGEGATLEVLGRLYWALKQYEKAEESFEQSLQIRREIKDKNGEAKGLNMAAIFYMSRGKYEKAKNYYEQGLLVAKESKNRSHENDIYWNLSVLWKFNLNNPVLAILYGKQAVNITQEIGWTPESKAFAYRRLAGWMISEGRIIEAQAVLDLLKREEFSQITKRRSGEVLDTIPYSKAETEVIGRIENLAYLSRRQTELQKEKEQLGDKFPAAKQQELDKIFTDTEVANRAFRESLDALAKAEKSIETQVAEIQSEKNLQRSLSQLGKELKTGAVAIYTVIGTEEEKNSSGKNEPNKTRSKFGWVILVTPEGRKAYPIDVRDLEQTVFQFRAALSSDKYDPRALAEKIYNAVFRQTSEKQKQTLEADLEKYFANQPDKTLMWSLDGVLRYIPMAALHDGKNYLVEKYRHIVFNKQSLLLLNEKDAARWQALGLGVSEQREGFSPLPGAERELKDIVRQPQANTGIFEGAIRLNRDFKKDETINLWRDGKYPVVHIASHYSFNPVDQTASFLLVGDGKISFADIQDKDNLFGAVDLLTLSACDTATSANGKEAESFAYLAQSLGAKSVLASLWKVSDEGTPELMIRFYQIRKENPEIPKGEAFRRAQLSLLRGATDSKREIKTASPKAKKTSVEVKESLLEKRSEIVEVGGGKIELPLYVKDAKRPFAHPHYWSSFVLIGNWR
jgi:CHAT domain-containing protein